MCVDRLDGHSLAGPGRALHRRAGVYRGILLVLGLASRLIAVPLTINMPMAFITADGEALLSVPSDPDKLTAAAPYTFLVASLTVLIFGPGKFAVDTWIAWKRRCVRNGTGLNAPCAGVPESG